MIDRTDGGSDTLWDNYYRDGVRYETIYVALPDDTLQYTFQYSGYEEEWATSKESWISVAYAHDSHGNGGSEGQGNVNRRTRKRLIGIFERELIDRVKVLTER